MSMSDTLPNRIKMVAKNYPSRPLQWIKVNGAFVPVTYREFFETVSQIGAGLSTLGVTRGAHVGIISDNRPQWLIADFAILGIGAADVPRGSDSTKEEISFILGHSDCTVAFVEDKVQMEKIFTGISSKSTLKTLILMDDSLGAHRKGPSSLQLLNYSEVIEKGKTLLRSDPDFFNKEMEKGRTGDLATIIYTSGTTGEPKGVMLTHEAFLFQIDRLLKILLLTEEDVFISVLPIWHSFERAVEYIVMGRGASLAYSKPIGKIMLEDMAILKPTYMASVPRIWESVYGAVYRNIRSQSPVKQGIFHFFVYIGSCWADVVTKLKNHWPRFFVHWNLPFQLLFFFPMILLWPLKKLGDLLVFRTLKNKLGGRFVAGISGGGALPGYIDKFFRSVGILVLEGYGLTETAPVLSVREQRRPMPETVGPLLPDVEYKILDEAGEPVGPGVKGVLWVKSPQVMLGYYKNPTKTEEVKKDGWLCTGDLVMATITGEIKIVGRAKDTIVLLGGENIEPEPIENRLLQSEFIDQVMVVGQDQKYLGALVVPNFDLLEKLASDRQIPYVDREELLDHAQIMEYVHEVIQYLVNPRNGFKAFERIYKFKLLPKAFQIGVEMTQSLKLKRNVIAEMYSKEIMSLFPLRDKD